MTLVYACDDNYTKLTAVSAVSALRHNSGARIVLLGCNLKEASIELIRSRVLLRVQGLILTFRRGKSKVGIRPFDRNCRRAAFLLPQIVREFKP